MPNEVRVRSRAWRWWVCGLLLCASTINYMDRQTLANAATRITREFHLTQQEYGNLEWAFGWAFAVGSLGFGFLVDRVSVRWVYPIVLLMWSSVGFATGWVQSYHGLFLCRAFLGLFEAGHWPCAIKTTQRLLESKDRSMGNSVLQSGTSIGAIVTPLLMRWLLTDELGSWRLAFQAVGAVGVLWIAAWFAMVRSHDLPVSGAAPGEPASAGRQSRPLMEVLLSRRMLAILITIALINTCWQTLRAWLPKFLQEGRGYSEAAALNFNSLFYVATDIGCLGAGALTVWLVRRSWSVHRSRIAIFSGCAMLTLLAVILRFLPAGHALEASLLLIGAGALGVFPIYHALTQDLSPDHQGKVTGIASVAAWAFAPPLQSLFGRLIDRTGSFDLGLAIAGSLPAIALIALWWLWKEPQIARRGEGF